MNTPNDKPKNPVLADVWSVQNILDASFQRCFQMCEKMPKKLERHISRDLHEIKPEMIRGWLEPIANEVYKDMARTMFHVLPLLQPQDFKCDKDVNFYFWPAYHMVLVGRRLFFAVDELDEELRLMGCGIWGNPKSSRPIEEWQEYTDCSHARWFNYATRRPKHLAFFPGSVYLWFNTQMPCASTNPYDLLRAFTILAPEAGPDVDDDPSAPILRLGADSKGWGHELMNELNNGKVGRHRRNPGHFFPNRPEKPPHEEQPLVDVRCRLLALFIHSAFCCKSPAWFEQLKQELQASGLDSVLNLQKTSIDPVAQDWGDRSTNRDLFQCWSTITLQPMLNAVPESSPIAAGETTGSLGGTLTNQSIGSSYIFSSVPLRKEYLAVVRDYVRKVYAMMRNFEQAINTQNLLYRARRTMVSQSAVLLHHEFNALVANRYQTVGLDIGKCDPQVVAVRKSAWHSVTSHANFLYFWSQAYLEKSPKAKSDLQERFMRPIQSLLSRGTLESTLKRVAVDVYNSNSHDPGATIVFPIADTNVGAEAGPEEYYSCFLLTAEIVRNFCKHERRAVEARWWAEIKHEKLNIRMSCPTTLDEPPAANTFRALIVLLKDLDLGDGNVTINGGCLLWWVQVNLSSSRGMNATT